MFEWGPMVLPRRGIALNLALALAALAAIPSGATAKGFTYGVAAGDVDTDSAILWARANSGGPVILHVRRGKATFPGDCRPGGIHLRASADRDFTVRFKVRDLDSGAKYRYRFCRDGGRRSEVGTFATAPGPNQARKVTFAMTGDQDALPEPGESEPYWGPFRVWSRVLKENNDFNVLLGDTIYSDTEVPGYTSKQVATSVKKKWGKYKVNLGQRPWTEVRGTAAYYAHWDDHEFINDFSPRENEFPLSVGTFRVNGRELYQRGVRAFRDYNPIGYSERNGIYRRHRWGKNLDVFFLDMRSFRSRNADYQGNCDNPQTGEPDLAPTAPQSSRNLFSVLAPSLAEPVSQGCLNRINDPDRTMLGEHQFNRFKKAIRNSTATWKVIFNELPIQQYYALPYDRWEGFEAERQKMLKFLQANVENVVFLTADVHASLVNDARLKTLEPGGPVNSGILDIVTGPIATANYSIEINDATGSEASAGALHAAFFKPEPPSGVGMDCASLTTDSYAQVTATKTKLTVELNDAAGNPVPDTPDGSPGPPCEPVVLTAE